MNFIRNRKFRAGPQTSLECFICPQNSDKKQKIKVFGRSGGASLVLLKTNNDTVIQVSIGYDATLHREERRVAA